MKRTPIKRSSKNKGKRTPKRRVSRMALRTKADDLFRDAIRERDGWACRNCGSPVHPQCAHIVSRRYGAVRWCMDNAVCLCKGCHMKFTCDPLGWDDWVDERFGPGRLVQLKLRARSGVAKVDLEGVIAALEGVAIP